MKIRWRLFAGENEPVSRLRGMRVYAALSSMGLDAGMLIDADDDCDVIVEQYSIRDSEFLIGRCDYLVADIADAVFLPHHPDYNAFHENITNCDWVTCSSQMLANHISTLFDPNCVTYIPEPLEESYRSLVRDPVGTGRILWMGMHDNAKFLMEFDDVFQGLSKKHSGMELVFVHSDKDGSGHSNAEFVENRPYRSEHVTWSPGNVLEQMKIADIAICPLPQNGWCRYKSVNKAAAFASVGLPVVATDIMSYRELFSETGSGFLCFSPDDWYDPLDKLLSGKRLRQTVGETGKKAAWEKYDISVVCSKFLSVIDRMMI